MNKYKTKLMTVLTAVTLGMALVSCDDNGGTTSSEEVTISRISNDGLPFLVLAKELDLDEYISVVYSDGTSDKNYTVSCDDDAVVFDKHVVLADAPGTYMLDVVSGTRKIRAELTVITKDHNELIDLFEPLEETPQNYVAGLYSYSRSGFGYIRSYYHTENYVAIFDEDDPVGEDNSTLIAQLSDGHAYWGYIGGSKTEPKAVFEPGYAMYNAYYLTNDLDVDPTDFTYDAENKMNLSSTTFEENLLAYSCSITSSSLSGTYVENGVTYQYQYSYAGAYLDDLYDFDNDGKDDTAFFLCMVNDDLEGDSGIYCGLAISFIGKANLDWMDETTTDASYVPEKIKAPEISTAFNNIAKAKNYTVTTKLYSADSEGSALPIGTDVSQDTLTLMTGSTSMEVTTTFDEHGVISKATGNTFEKSGDIYVGTTTTTTKGEFAYWDDGTDTYVAEYDEKAEALGTPTKSIEGKTVYESGKIDGFLASNITESVANETIWTSKTTSGNVVTFKGQAGDDDGAEKTNTLFKYLFNMNGFGLIQLQTGSESFGDFMTESEEFTGGNKHALTCYSDYTSFQVNTETNEVTLAALLYVPIGYKNYIVAQMTFSNIGTTVNEYPSTTSGSSSSSAA